MSKKIGPLPMLIGLGVGFWILTTFMKKTEIAAKRISPTMEPSPVAFDPKQELLAIKSKASGDLLSKLFGRNGTAV